MSTEFIQQTSGSDANETKKVEKSEFHVRTGVKESDIKDGKVTKTFSFTVPTKAVVPSTGEAHPDAGKEMEKTYTFTPVTNMAEVDAVLKDKEWTIEKLVNDALRSNARSNAYQSALLNYQKSDVSLEDIKERSIRDFIRMGFTEEIARKQVESMLAQLPSK